MHRNCNLLLHGRPSTVDRTAAVIGVIARTFVENRLPHLHSAPPLGGLRQNTAITFGTQKLEWCGYPTVKIFKKYLYSFRQNTSNVTDRRTPHDGIDHAYAQLRAVAIAWVSWHCFQRVCVVYVCVSRKQKVVPKCCSVDHHTSGCDYFGRCLYVCLFRWVSKIRTTRQLPWRTRALVWRGRVCGTLTKHTRHAAARVGRVLTIISGIAWTAAEKTHATRLISLTKNKHCTYLFKMLLV